MCEWCEAVALELQSITNINTHTTFILTHAHTSYSRLHTCTSTASVSSPARFQFHAHTVDLVYQSSLLHTREELAMVVVGPLTLNAVTFLLVLIRWGCQQIFGSLPSFTSKFIMAQGVWTVLDPLAVFAVDAVLGVSHLKITWTLVHFK